MPEICGDVQLGTGERRAYLSLGVEEIRRSLADVRPSEVFTPSLDSAEVRHNIAEGASPLRIYTCALADEIGRMEAAREPGTILDLGCGSGAQARFFDPAPGTAYVGVDILKSRDWTAPQKEGPGVVAKTFVEASAEHLPLHPDSLSFTYSSHCLEHVQDVKAAVRNLLATTKPGALGLHIAPGVWSLPLYTLHGYRRFSPASLADLFEEAGFEVVKVWSLGGLATFFLHAFWITWLETGLLYDWLPVPGVPRVLRRGLHWYGRHMRTGPVLRVYSFLLARALELDRLIPGAPVGVGVLVRRP